MKTDTKNTADETIRRCRIAKRIAERTGAGYNGQIYEEGDPPEGFRLLVPKDWASHEKQNVWQLLNRSTDVARFRVAEAGVPEGYLRAFCYYEAA